jgi:hypothetical protein
MYRTQSGRRVDNFGGRGSSDSLRADCIIAKPSVAEVAKLADAPALGAGGRKAVGVRVPSSAPFLRSMQVDVRNWIPYTGISIVVRLAGLSRPFLPLI